MTGLQTLPPPEGPEYTPCACRHIEPEHEPKAGACWSCDCESYRPAADRAAAAPPPPAPLKPAALARALAALDHETSPKTCPAWDQLDASGIDRYRAAARRLLELLGGEAQR